MEINPYAAPESFAAAAPVVVQARGKKLHTENHVALAAFLGSPLAGSIVLAINFARLGRQAAALGSLLLGTLATVVLFGLAFAVPLPNGAGVLLGLGYAMLMRLIAKRLQGEELAAHVKAGGAIASAWSAVGISIIAFVALFAAIVAVVLGLGI
jgi:hypothetical protein